MFIPDDTRTKLDAKSKQMVFVGYSNTSKAFRLWDPGTNKVKESNDVTFDETAGEFSSPTPIKEITD
jgi:hypothetical protein